MGWEKQWPQGQFRLSNDQFNLVLSNTKIAVCPWGWTAWTWRDVEAIMHGCAVVKPRCDEVRIHPDLYHPDTSWLYWCEPDFSDLQEVVDGLLDRIEDERNNFPCLLSMRMMEESSPEVARTMFVDSIKECLK